jgi:hypothetical protein
MPTKVRGKAGAGPACRVCGAQSSGQVGIQDVLIPNDLAVQSFSYSNKLLIWRYLVD